jgi:hypothetical protein
LAPRKAWALGHAAADPEGKVDLYLALDRAGQLDRLAAFALLHGDYPHRAHVTLARLSSGLQADRKPASASAITEGKIRAAAASVIDMKSPFPKTASA